MELSHVWLLGHAVLLGLGLTREREREDRWNMGQGALGMRGRGAGMEKAFRPKREMMGCMGHKGKMCVFLLFILVFYFKTFFKLILKVLRLF